MTALLGRRVHSAADWIEETPNNQSCRSGLPILLGPAGLPTDDPDNPADTNSFQVMVDGVQYVLEVNNDVERWYFGSNFATDHPIADAPALEEDQVNLSLGFWDIRDYDLSLHATLEIFPAKLEAWQTSVVKLVRSIEQKRIDGINADLRTAYLSRLGTYQNRLGEIRATAVNDLLQGQSEFYNRQLIVRELKRQCITALTREFDPNRVDDKITDMEALGGRNVEFRYRRLSVEEEPPEDPTTTSASFVVETKSVTLPLPDLDVAREKGRFIQFFEQAFEWQQLSYLCYPYFWATPPKWIDLMARSDDADPFLTAFLQAGAVRVLVAVTPADDDAVLHFLATGEPWQGGPAPVIGEPLYIPIYEEIRRQQDDMVNAVPDGDPWTFTLPTSLVYLQDSSSALPPLDDSG